MALRFPEAERARRGGLRRLVEVDTSPCPLDTTSVSFHGEGPEGLAELGYSRDKRPDLRQMVLGVMTSSEGLPLGHVVPPGSTVEVEALVAEVEVLRERLAVGRPVLVFDQGMQLRELALDGWRYIAAARLRTKLTRAALARPGRYRTVPRTSR